jgi:uncharacterized membrane protein YecN with MAPEG domain
MQTHTWVALVTLLSLTTYLAFGIMVGRLRLKTGIAAPACTGHPLFERALRVQTNTLEWLPIYLGALWLFALYWNDRVAAALGAIWIVGRILYARGYMADPAKRGPGFMLQALATLVLLLGALGRVVLVLAAVGG